jgi:phosphonate transport system substrate-binding protein
VTYKVGAVAYDPRVVTIWESFRRWFTERGFPLEYVLFSTYDEQVEALLAGWVDTAWNTNLAHVQTRLRAGDGARGLAMRDTDRDWTSVALVKAEAPRGLESLRGRRVGFGDSDSPQAWILPAHAMRRQGLDPDTDLIADRLDRDLGKHGDTGRAELAQAGRLRAGELDACIVSNWTLAALRAYGADEGLDVAWTSPPFHHCTFTAVDGDETRHARFAELLRAMDAADPGLCEAMRLENVSRWLDADESGYADLLEAVRWRSG